MPKLMKSMNIISRCQSIYRTERLGEVISSCQHTFVLAICRGPGRSQEELARDICLNKSTVARTLCQLEADGYVERVLNPEDKRQSLVYPTDKMLKLLPDIKKIAGKWNDLIAKGISEEELDVFESVLKKMEKSAKEAVNGTEATS